MRKKVKNPKFKFKTVMLIDDNEMDNYINRKIIETNFFAKRIYMNTNGLDALEFLNSLLVKKESLNETMPEVIFVDINMPIINGFQFIQKFYEMPNEFVNKSKIVILTSSLNSEDKEVAHRLKPNIIFLKKPLRLESLAAIS
jgi:CheY-like chemotaxis protein